MIKTWVFIFGIMFFIIGFLGEVSSLTGYIGIGIVAYIIAYIIEHWDSIRIQ